MRFRLRTLLIVSLLLCVSAPWWNALYQQSRSVYERWRDEYESRNSRMDFGGPSQDEVRTEHLRQMWGTTKQFER